MKRYRTDKWDMPSKQSSRNNFYSIIYNREDWDYTLSRISPNQREIKTLKATEKEIIEFDMVPWVGNPRKDRQKWFCKAHLEKSLGPHNGKVSLFHSSPFIQSSSILPVLLYISIKDSV